MISSESIELTLAISGVISIPGMDLSAFSPMGFLGIKKIFRQFNMTFSMVDSNVIARSE
jgi:hypothetical protein